MRPLMPVLGALVLGSGGCSTESALDTPSALGTAPGADSGTLRPTDAPTDTGADVERFGQLVWSRHPGFASLIEVRWRQTAREDVQIEYSVDPGEWRRTPVVRGQVGANVTLLAGIPFHVPDAADGDDSTSKVPWRVVSATGAFTVDADLPIEPAAAPDGLPIPQVVASRPDEWVGGEFLLTSINEEQGGWTGGRYWVAIYDREGRPVWAQAVPNHHWSLYPQRSQAGDHLLWDESTRWSDNDRGAGSRVHRTYLDGEREVIATPGLHHAFVDVGEGTLAWGSLSLQHSDSEALVELRPGSPEPFVLWTCVGDWPGAEAHPGGCESNGLFFDHVGKRYLFSFYTNQSVVEIQRSTGATLWWAGGLEDGYTFSPAESQFTFQHGVSYTPGGTLLLSTEGQVQRNDGSVYATTWLREYEVDRARRQLIEVWRHDAGVHAATNGHAERLDDRHTLHVLGSASEVIEVDVYGDVVWHIDFGGSQLLGRGEILSDLYALLDPGVPR